VPVEDIDRIEVIRGPGATVWGANAVNGVINIITKSSKATQGGTLVGGGGTRPGALGLLQYGAKLGGKGYYRAFGDYFNDPNEAAGLGFRAADAWRMSHGGFRVDWDLTAQDSLTVEGDISNNNEGTTITSFVSFLPPFTETFNDPARATSGSLLARWEHKFRGGSDTMVQVYYDDLRHLELGIHADKGTLDFQFQQHLAVGSRHDFVWGMGYREDAYYDRASYALAFIPPGRTDQLFNSFAQDEIRLSNTFWLTVGSKFEHNSYTGFEYEPSGRFLWSPSGRQAFWGSVSRAIRQPSREDTDIELYAQGFPSPEGVPMVVTVFGNPNFKSEKLLAYELGYRVVPIPRVSLDLATFYNVYHDLRAEDALNPYFDESPVPHEVIPEMFSNAMHGNTYGAEISSTLNVFRWWRVTPGYSRLQMNLHLEPGSDPRAGYQLAGGDSPRNQYQIRSSINLGHNLELDSGAYYVDRLPDQFVPSHTRLDLRLGWHPTESTQFSIVGQNLQQPRHFEFGSQSDLEATQIKRSVYGEIRWWF